MLTVCHVTDFLKFFVVIFDKLVGDLSRRKNFYRKKYVNDSV